MNIVVKGVGTANPPMYVTQEEAYEFFSTQFDLSQDEHDLYRRILLDGKIRGRYVGMDATHEALETDADRLLARFLKFGRTTAATAARRALQDAAVDAADIAGLVVNTCTGYLCPGLSSYIAEDLGLPSSIRYQDLMGMGCGAAVPNLESAAGMLARSEAPSLPYFIRNLVGLDRAAAQAAFSEFLGDRSLTPPQIRFVEMVIDQLTSRGVMEASALYEVPFSNLHAGGPEELFAGKENVIEGIFEKLSTVNDGLVAKAG